MNLQAYTCKSRLYNIIYCFWIWILNIYYYYYIVIVILLLSILQGAKKGILIDMAITCLKYLKVEINVGAFWEN